MDIKDDVRIRSWDGTWTYRPKVLVTPETPEDVVEIVKSVVRCPSPVRPAGSMHSTARMNGDDGGTMVDMKAMNRILKFGEDCVTVEAGATYIVVSNALKERGKMEAAVGPSAYQNAQQPVWQQAPPPGS